MELLGTYTHTLDSKNRVFFPAKFREELGAPIVITVTVDKCLAAYSLDEWNKYLAKVTELPKTKARQVKRFLCGNAQKSTPDGQGRVMLPKTLLDYAGIIDSVTFVACGDMVELWPTEKAQTPDIYNEEEIDELCDMMEEYGL